LMAMKLGADTAVSPPRRFAMDAWHSVLPMTWTSSATDVSGSPHTPHYRPSFSPCPNRLESSSGEMLSLEVSETVRQCMRRERTCGSMGSSPADA
jgi:hypothetical protein